MVNPKVLSLIAYRLFFHPLRNYPGPLLAKVSDLYPGFYALSMRLHLATYQDQKRYGELCRLLLSPLRCQHYIVDPLEE